MNIEKSRQQMLKIIQQMKNEGTYAKNHRTIEKRHNENIESKRKGPKDAESKRKGPKLR